MSGGVISLPWFAVDTVLPRVYYVTALRVSVRYTYTYTYTYAYAYTYTYTYTHIHIHIHTIRIHTYTVFLLHGPLQECGEIPTRSIRNTIQSFEDKLICARVGVYVCL